MTPDVFIKAQMAAFCHREAAHHGGIDNLLAVAFVMRNRQRAGWHGGDWMRILAMAEEQAAWVYPPTVVELRDPQFRIFLSQVDDVFTGLAPDRMTEGALYYAELNRISSDWFRANISTKPLDHPRVATVGNVSFFR